MPLVGFLGGALSHTYGVENEEHGYFDFPHIGQWPHLRDPQLRG
jgi:hypothetical protein